MTRRHDWPDILVSHLTGLAGLPGKWGKNDCATNPADLGIAMGHRDILEGLRGYRTARGASRKLREAGYRDLEALVAARMDEVPLGMARRADVALIHHRGKRGIWKFSLAVIDHDGSLVGPGEHHQERLPRQMAIRAFRFRD